MRVTTKQGHAARIVFCPFALNMGSKFNPGSHIGMCWSAPRVKQNSRRLPRRKRASLGQPKHGIVLLLCMIFPEIVMQL
jgi:hypothetical protein